MDFFFSFILDDFEFRMIYKDTTPRFFRAPEHDHFLTGREHLPDIILVEPTTDKAAAQCGRNPIFENYLHDLAATKILSRDLLNNATDTDWHLRSPGWKLFKPGSVFVPARIVFQQLAPRLDPKSRQKLRLWLRKPGKFGKRLI
jgi:hypothetical protein